MSSAQPSLQDQEFLRECLTNVSFMNNERSLCMFSMLANVGLVALDVYTTRHLKIQAEEEAVNLRDMAMSLNQFPVSFWFVAVRTRQCATYT